MRNGFQAQLPSKCHPSSGKRDYSLYSQLLCQILLALFHQSHPRHPGEKQTLAPYPSALAEVRNEKQLAFDAIYEETEAERQLCRSPASRSLRQAAVHRGHTEAGWEFKPGGEQSWEYPLVGVTEP